MWARAGNSTLSYDKNLRLLTRVQNYHLQFKHINHVWIKCNELMDITCNENFNHCLFPNIKPLLDIYSSYFSCWWVNNGICYYQISYGESKIGYGMEHGMNLAKHVFEYDSLGWSTGPRYVVTFDYVSLAPAPATTLELHKWIC